MLGTSKEKTGASFVHNSDHEGIIDTPLALGDKLDLLFEKRHTVRVAALKAINTALTMRVSDDLLQDRQERFVDGMSHVLQRHIEAESLLALKAVSLAALSLIDGKVFYSRMETILLKLLADETEGRQAAVCGAALEALSVVTFMNSEEGDHVVSVSYTISGVFYRDQAKTTPAEYASALDAWTLLLTTIDDSVIKSHLFPENIEKLNEFLNHSDYSVRVAAGRALVVLVEALRNEYRQENDIQEFEKVDLYLLESGEVDCDWDGVVAKLSQFSAEKSKLQSKLEAKKQKRIFREFVASIEEDERPHESMVIKRVRLDLDSWTQILQLDHFRGILGEGFIHHMAANTNLMNIFDYQESLESVPLEPQFTKKERRRSVVEAEKVYTRFMETSRRARERERDLAGFASE